MLRCSMCGSVISETIQKPVTTCKSCGVKLVRLSIAPWSVSDKTKNSCYTVTEFVKEERK